MAVDLERWMSQDRTAKVWNVIDVTLMQRHLDDTDKEKPDFDCPECIVIMENATRLPDPTAQDVFDALEYAVARDAVLAAEREQIKKEKF